MFSRCRTRSRSYRSSLHGSVQCAAHSTDAELRAMFMALKRTVAFRHFLEYLGYAQALPAPTRHHEDNQPSINIISANKVTSRVRHVHIPICYMHYHYDCGTFAPSFCKGTLMCADICTKPTAGPLHHRHFNWLRGARFCLYNKQDLLRDAMTRGSADD